MARIRISKPSGWLLLLAAEVLFVALVAYFFLVGDSRPEDQGLTAGKQLYADYCAKCHGANLEGQPDWMVRKPDGKLPAPPHDASGHTWHHSDKQLFLITKEGLAAIVPGYETDMPAFAGVLSDEQVRRVLDYIKSTWPEHERTIQEARSKADP